ncbi:hypothetical protein AB9K29_00225 [Phaeobacter italicus]|uniref:hypothetical protein n=1 Tax=Phaeobacter italicus TaxID=481446 RepID=UPI0035113B96
MGYAQTIISALLFLPFFFQYANAQNIEQHRNLLSSVDLEDREYPVLSERLLLTQMEIVPSCRKNFSHEKCNNTAHQFIQGPITRSFYLPETEFGFLSNTLANRFHNATTLSEWNSVHKYCSENTIEKFHRWMASTSETDFEEYIYVTYLPPMILGFIASAGITAMRPPTSTILEFLSLSIMSFGYGKVVELSGK